MDTFKRFLVISGLTPVTVTGHIKAVERIGKRIGTMHPTIEEAKNYIADLYLSGYSYSHKSNQAKALEYWMQHIDRPIIFGRQRKPRPLLKNTLTESEVTRLVISTKNAKEKAILLLLAYSGLRPKELCAIKIENINFGSNELRVEKGKGMKDRIVYLPSKCIEAVMQYLALHQYMQSDFLFYTYQKKKYTPQALRKLIKVLARRASINKRIYPYLLRHSLATNMVKRGTSILTVKEHLGHAWIETTMLYIHSIGMQERNEQSFPQYV